MQFYSTTPRQCKSIRRCANCHKTLKNTKKYIAYPRTYIKEGKDGNKSVWFGIAKECRRCGYTTEAS